MTIRDGADIAAARLREPGTATACLLAFSVELGIALLERAQGRAGAADRALSGGTFGLVLPLLCYMLVARVCDAKNLNEAVLPLARHGMSRRELIIGLALPPALIAAAFGAISGVAVVALTRGTSDTHLLRDSLTSLWIGAAAGFAYVTALVGASALGARGQGRIWLLAGDFVLGAGTSFLAVPWPKGHVRNLLGGAPVLELSQQAALLVLLGTSFASLSWATLRSPR